MSWFTPSSSSSSRRYQRSPSYYRRRPRDGYVNKLIHQLRRIVRDLVKYARRHPVKLFMMVVMPLLTGGALHGVLRQFGIRLPSARSGIGSVFGDGYSSYSRSGGYGDLGGVGTFQNLMRVAQAFM